MPEHSETAARVARELRVTVGRLRRRLQEVASDTELRPAQTSVLTRLGKHGPSTGSRLAVAERVRPQSMAATLSTLEHAGLVRRSPDADDGRKLVVTLTSAGWEHVTGERAAGAEWLTAALSERYSKDELRQLLSAMALLERLAD